MTASVPVISHGALTWKVLREKVVEGMNNSNPSQVLTGYYSCLLSVSKISVVATRTTGNPVVSRADKMVLVRPIQRKVYNKVESLMSTKMAASQP